MCSGRKLRSHARRQPPACTTPRPYRPVEASHPSGESDRKQPQLRCRLDGSDERSAYFTGKPHHSPCRRPHHKLPTGSHLVDVARASR